MRFWRRLSLKVKAASVASLLFCASAVIVISLMKSFNAEMARHFGPQWLAIVAAFFSLLFIVIASYLLTTLFVHRPLERLIRIMRIAEEKDFLIRAPVNSQDVIGRLSECFNRLMERTTTLDSVKIETERKLIQIQEELKFQKALEEKNKRLSFLYEVAHMISAAIDFNDLVKVLSEVISRRLGFKEFAILLWDPEQEALVVRHTIGFHEEIKVANMSFKLGEGVSGIVAQTRQMIYIPDTRQDKRYLHYKGQKAEDVSFVSLPLIVGQELVGVMNLSRPGVNDFTPEELELLQAIANQVAVAFHNANLYSQTRTLSIKDALTDLHNRRYLQQILPAEIKRSERYEREFSIVMIDIDHFKEYNDARGHLEGDKVLQDFSKLLRHKLRESDVIVRFGGDEFLVLLPNTTKQHAAQVAMKLIEAISRHVFQDSKGQAVENFTVSVGIGSYPKDAQTVTDLIHKADSALYHSKREGRNKVACWDGNDFKLCRLP